jgi:hypothetical protein
MEWQIQSASEANTDGCLAYTVAVWDAVMGDARAFAPWDKEVCPRSLRTLLHNATLLSHNASALVHDASGMMRQSSV